MAVCLSTIVCYPFSWLFVGKARKKAWQVTPYVYFGQYERKGIC